jgi:ribosomal-protein-alanine N-acetyltransferase
MNLETERLLIREPQPDDWRGAMSFLADAAVMRRIHMGPDPYTDEQARQWIADLIFHNSQRPRFSHNSLIVERESEQIVGWIGFGKPSTPDIADLDFGYALAQSGWGKGYMTEALRAIFSFIFGELDANSVYAICEVDNPGSSRVMEKAGMRRVLRYLDPDDLPDKQTEMYRYLITKADWLAQQPD